MSNQNHETINECLRQIRSNRSMTHVEMLYDCICPTIRHIGLKYLHRTDLADDFVQDFWADIYRIADGFFLHVNGHAYLCKVATNRAINRWKQLTNENLRIVSVDYSEYQPPDRIDDTEQLNVKIAVEQAMKQLSETERIIIQSTYFEQKTVREIASELHMSKSQVDRLKQRALATMREFLTDGTSHPQREEEFL